MRIKEFTISSFVVMVTLGCGIAVGYVAGKMSNQRIIDQGVHQGFLRRGKYGLEWDYYRDIDALKSSREYKPLGVKDEVK